MRANPSTLATCLALFALAGPARADEPAAGEPPAPAEPAPPAEATSPPPPGPAPGTASDAPSTDAAVKKATATRELNDIEARAANAGFAPKLLARAAGEARRALERARGARAAGDDPHAALLERLSSEWTLTARTQLRAAQAEREADEVGTRARDLQQKLERARGVLLQQHSRRKGLEAQVQQAEAAAEAARTDAAAAERARLQTSPTTSPKKGGGR